MAGPLLYLDNNASTAVGDAAREAMAPFLGPEGGNPSSLHAAGRRAREAVERARPRVAALVGAKPAEVVFTSGGTEADALAVLGALEAAGERRRVVASAVEHPAVRDLLRALRERGRIDLVEVAPAVDGTLDAERVLDAVLPDTALVTVMWANNETGMIHPAAAIARGCRERGVPFHTDAVQAAGKTALDAGEAPADLLSLSAHKFHGPKGVGALVVRRGARWRTPFASGPQEGGRRGGTENVPGIAGMGAAAEEARAGLAVMPRVAALRDRLEEAILAGVPGARRATAAAPRVPNTTCLLFPGLEGEMLVLRLDARGIACSSGSACSEGSARASPVLRAMGIPDRDARGALRLSLSRSTTAEEVETAARAVIEEATELRKRPRT
jgi:cysteine desulfurase